MSTPQQTAAAMTTSELRAAAARALGWKLGMSNGGWDSYFVRNPLWVEGSPLDQGEFKIAVHNWLPDESHDQAKLLIAEVERQGKQHAFAVLLGMAVFPHGWTDWRDTWAIINATPLQKTEAAVEVLGGGE